MIRSSCASAKPPRGDPPAAPRRLVYLCDWLPPDFGAVGQYSLGFAREYAREGWDVVLVGLSSRHPLRTVEEHGTGRLTVVRVATADYAKERWRERLRWTVRTNLRLLRAAAPAIRRADEVLFTGSPPFMLPFVMLGNLVWRKRLVYRITDFYPECLIAALAREPSYLRLVHRLTCSLRRRVDRFQVLGLDQMRRLEASGVPRDRIVLKRDPSPVRVTGFEAPLPVPEPIRGHAVLLYSGNWGVAHDVGTFVEGYVRHHRAGPGRVALWLNAIGAGADEAEALLARAGVPFARTRPVRLDELARLLATPDAHLITLKDAFVGYVMPSKVYGCIESGRPVLFVGSRDSDVALLCEEAVAGGGLPWYRRVGVGDAGGVARALDEIGRMSARGAPVRVAPAAARLEHAE